MIDLRRLDIDRYLPEYLPSDEEELYEVIKETIWAILYDVKHDHTDVLYSDEVGI